MAVVQRSEFALALNQIASERSVDPSVVLDTIKGAILAAFRKDNPGPEEENDLFTVDLNENTGETKILKEGKDVTPPGFGRIAAQTAKQVLLQKIREREKDAVIEEYSKRMGMVVNAMILRFIGPAIVVDIGKAEALMEPADKIPNEQYFLNKKMPVLIRAIDEEKREILVSRSNPGLVEGLLKREVPEVNSGSVVIKKIVREPGNRVKIAVYSETSGIDPVGSCVGQKGVRIQAVIDALDGLEKIDIIQWSPEPAKFIINALSPAKNLKVEINEKEKTAKITAPREELPLVIGREGQNVRLASKLTEYTIEVEGEETPVAESSEVSEKSDAQTSESVTSEKSEEPKVNEAKTSESSKNEKTEESEESVVSDSSENQTTSESEEPKVKTPAVETSSEDEEQPAPLREARPGKTEKKKEEAEEIKSE